MPLKKARTKKAIRENYKELMTGEVGEARRKGIKTLMKRKGLSRIEAKRYQARVIALAVAGRSKKKKKNKK